MNTTKHSHGIRLVAIICYLASTLSACNKDLPEPENYTIQVKNDYFETIDSIMIDTISIGQLPTGALSDSITLPKGTYPFSCNTSSHLKITANINLQGTKPYLAITINPKGKISIQ